MKRFFTKYHPSFYFGSDGVQMNPYDAVDRLSYIDSTTQIVRMMQAGVNLKLQNSQLMSYDGDMNAPSIPVYAPDISVAYKRLHELKDELKENERKNREAYEAAVAAKNVSKSAEQSSSSQSE